MPEQAPILPDALVGNPDRLAALLAYDILDTPPETGFDDMAQLAAALCEAPTALVSFVSSDRQWLKALVNFPARETDLDRSVCKFVLGEPDLLVVPDLVIDARTASNPLVTGEQHIRFYAGVPLRTPEGQVLGSLCVIDHVPRPAGLTHEQAEHLRRCARQIMSLLQMRRLVAQRDEVLARQDAELRRERHLAVLAEASAALLATSDPVRIIEPILATTAASLGFEQCVIYDVAPDGRHLQLTQSIGVSDEVRQSLLYVGFDELLCGIVAETCRPLVLTSVLASVETRHEFARRGGIDAFAGYPVTSRGKLVGVISFSTTIRPAFDDSALTFFATIARYLSAISERLDGEATVIRNEAKWRTVLETLREGFVLGKLVRDEAGRVVDWRYDQVNRAWYDLVGIEPGRAVGRTIRELFPDIEDEWIREFAVVVETKASFRFTRQVGALGRWYDGIAQHTGGDHFTVIFIEVTERILRERRQAALMTLADRLAQEVTLAGMCLAASSIVGHALEVEFVGYGDVDPAAETITIERDWTEGTVDILVGTLHFRDFGSYVDDLKAGRTVVVQDCRTDARTVDHAAALEARGARAFVNMPVFEHGTFVALFYVVTASPRDWALDELAFIRDVASRLRLAVSRVQVATAQDVLNQEISHRLKNTLAIVMSIAGQTFRSMPDQEPVQVFERRIQALSSAHDVLLRKNWASASAHEVVQTVLAAAGHAERIDVSGPDIDLGPSATLSLSLVLHELTTNAAKYGALSVAEGRVAIKWSVSGSGREAEVSMDWTERGGPGAIDPAVSGRQGFGSRLIRRGLTGTGGVELHYTPTGFQSSMRARIVQLQDV